LSKKLELVLWYSQDQGTSRSLIELVFPTLSLQGKNHGIRVLVEEALDWIRDELAKVMML
jgi:hypothetical protein